MRRGWGRVATWIGLLTMLPWARPAAAQQWQAQGLVELESGIAGGGPQARLLRRARTTLRAGVQLGIDEHPRDGLQVTGVLEMEPRAAFGAEVHWVRAITPRVWAGVGPVAIFTPDTLFGASMLADYRFPLGSRVQFALGATFQIFVLGSDLPSGDPIWQGMLRGGFHVDL